VAACAVRLCRFYLDYLFTDAYSFQNLLRSELVRLPALFPELFRYFDSPSWLSASYLSGDLHPPFDIYFSFYGNPSSFCEVSSSCGDLPTLPEKFSPLPANIFPLTRNYFHFQGVLSAFAFCISRQLLSVRFLLNPVSCLFYQSVETLPNFCLSFSDIDLVFGSDAPRLSGCPEARFLSAFENYFSPCRSLLFPSTMIKSDCSATFNLFVLHHQDLISHAWLPGLSIWGDRLRFYQTPIFIWVWFASPDYPANNLNHESIPNFLIRLSPDRSNRLGFQAVNHLHKSYPAPEIRDHHAI